MKTISYTPFKIESTKDPEKKFRLEEIKDMVNKTPFPFQALTEENVLSEIAGFVPLQEFSTSEKKCYFLEIGSGIVGIRLRIDKKKIPSSLVNEHVNLLLKDKETVSKIERRKAKEQALEYLLAKSFFVPKEIDVFFDLHNQEVFVGSNSNSEVDTFHAFFYAGENEFGLSANYICPEVNTHIKNYIFALWIMSLENFEDKEKDVNYSLFFLTNLKMKREDDGIKKNITINSEADIQFYLEAMLKERMIPEEAVLGFENEKGKSVFKYKTSRTDLAVSSLKTNSIFEEIEEEEKEKKNTLFFYSLVLYTHEILKKLSCEFSSKFKSINELYNLEKEIITSLIS